MMNFLRPSTCVYIGATFEVQAVITAVSIRGCGCPVYTVEYWNDTVLVSNYMERYQFSLEQGAADASHKWIEVQENDDL